MYGVHSRAGNDAQDRTDVVRIYLLRYLSIFLNAPYF